MTRHMTLQEFSQRIGISTGTIWRALNNHPEVSPKTAEKVRKQIEKLGYRPNWSARALATGRTQIVSVWMSMLNNVYSSTILQEIWDLLRQSDYDMLVKDISSLHEHSVEFVRRAETVSDGIIVVEPWDMAPWVQEYLNHTDAQRIPIVTIGDTGASRFDQVTFDLETASLELLDHLWSAGCRRIAFVLPARKQHAGESRHDAYSQFIKARGIEPLWITMNDDRPPSIMKGVADHLDQCGRPDGIFCYNDATALAVCTVLRDRGLKVPADVLVAGCDGIESTYYLESPLTTLVLPVRAMCERAWEYLQTRIAQPGLAKRQTVLRPELQANQSTRR